jgi:hypothetical protein
MWMRGASMVYPKPTIATVSFGSEAPSTAQPVQPVGTRHGASFNDYPNEWSTTPECSR